MIEINIKLGGLHHKFVITNDDKFKSFRLDEYSNMNVQRTQRKCEDGETSPPLQISGKPLKCFKHQKVCLGNRCRTLWLAQIRQPDP